VREGEMRFLIILAEWYGHCLMESRRRRKGVCAYCIGTDMMYPAVASTEN